jgi:hypothetical protein
MEHNDDVIQNLYEFIDSLGKNQQLSCKTISIFVLKLMQVVEKSKHLSGVEKKDCIIVVLDHYIDKNMENLENANELKMFVNLVVPNMIDVYIGLDKNKIKINMMKKVKKCLF